MNENLLDESYYKLREFFPRTSHIFTLRDQEGRYANVVSVNTFPYVLCAKGSMNGDEVSFHEELVNEARRRKTKIILYVKDRGKSSGNFYVFLTEDIDRDGRKWNNNRQGQTMVNVSIRLGTNLKRLIAEKAQHQKENQNE